MTQNKQEGKSKKAKVKTKKYLYLSNSLCLKTFTHLLICSDFVSFVLFVAKSMLWR